MAIVFIGECTLTLVYQDKNINRDRVWHWALCR